MSVDPPGTGLDVVLIFLGVILLAGLAFAFTSGLLARFRRELERPEEDERAEPGLREEVRQLVVAANERRARRGEPPLDVDAEVERRLRELEGGL